MHSFLFLAGFAKKKVEKHIDSTSQARYPSSLRLSFPCVGRAVVFRTDGASCAVCPRKNACLLSMVVASRETLTAGGTIQKFRQRISLPVQARWFSLLVPAVH